MKTRKLDRLTIPKPCSSDWKMMLGDEKKRFCSECNKYVYDISKLTRTQAEALVASKQGQLCARLTRQPDGKVITEDMRPGVQLLGRRASPIASAVITAILGLNSGALAYSSAHPSEPVPTHSYGERGDKERADPQNPLASLSGTIQDPSGAVIPNCNITLKNLITGDEQKTTSSESGEYRFFLIEPGRYTLIAAAQGFSVFTLEEIALVAGEERRIDVSMDLLMATMGGAIVAQPEPLRALYDGSDLVVIARVGKSTRMGNEKDATVRTELHVLSTLKGDSSEQVIHLDDLSYYDENPRFNKGDNLLLFLESRQTEEEEGVESGYELKGYSRGARKLSESDMDVYRRRIEELNAIEKQDGSKTEALVEWLVRCVEEQATRWEGGFELEASNSKLCGSGSGANRTSVLIDEVGSFNFAALLTPEQKDRITATLFNVDQITEDELPLVEIIATWNDPRFLPFLMAQLRLMQADPPPLAESLLQTVADALDDEDVTRLADQYLQNSTYDDEEDDAGEEGEASDQTQREASASLQASQIRSKMLGDFLVVAQSKIKD